MTFSGLRALHIRSDRTGDRQKTQVYGHPRLVRSGYEYILEIPKG